MKTLTRQKLSDRMQALSEGIRAAAARLEALHRFQVAVDVRHDLLDLADLAEGREPDPRRRTRGRQLEGRVAADVAEQQRRRREREAEQAEESPEAADPAVIRSISALA